MSKVYIVWNSPRNEGFITDDLVDAEYCSTGETNRFATSTLADSFREIYGDGPFYIEEVEVEG